MPISCATRAAGPLGCPVTNGIGPDDEARRDGKGADERKKGAEHPGERAADLHPREQSAALPSSRAHFRLTNRSVRPPARPCFLGGKHGDSDDFSTAEHSRSPVDDRRKALSEPVSTSVPRGPGVMEEPMVSRQALAPGDSDRAILALERAVACAEHGTSDLPVVLASAEDLRAVSPADVRSRLDRMMLATRPDEGLEALLGTPQSFDCTLPRGEEYGRLLGDGEWRHKDVWKHTKQVVMQATPRLEVRWSALFHDVGKVKTRSFGPNGEVHFFGHAEVGARMFDKLERRERLFSIDSKDTEPPRVDSFPGLAPPAREPVRRRLDRQRRAPVRARDGLESRRPALPVPRRHHDEAPGEEAPRHQHDRGAGRAHHAPRRRGRGGRTAPQRRRQRDHGSVRHSAVEAHR